LVRIQIEKVGENPDILCKSTIEIRDIIMHEYFDVYLNIIWNILIKNISEMKPLIKEFL